jgi:ribosomal protein L11 methyltransferase
VRSIDALDLHFPPLAGRADLPDRVATLLDDFGLAAVHETGDEERPIWRIFPSDLAQVGAVAAALTATFSVDGCRVERVVVPHEDWAARTQAALTRISVGRVTVAPPWDVPETLPPDAHLVVIQPSMGFGTGHHETTRLCLRLLQQLEVKGLRVIDVGTGSGVLAMAAHLLGAMDVEAIDVDDDAIVSARESLTLNGLTNHVTLRRADIGTATIEPANLVLANLTGALLVTQAPRLMALVRPGGGLVLSGFQRGETALVEAAFSVAVSRVRLVEGDWEALHLQIRT